MIAWSVVGASFLLGLAGAPHCMAMCGGIACAAGALPAGRSALALATFYRLITYGSLGAAAALLLQPLAHWSALDTLLRIGVGAVMILSGIWILRRRSQARASTAASPWTVAALRRTAPLVAIERLAGRVRAAGGQSPVLFGIGWGLLPCGMIYGALALNAASASPATAALGMLAFGLGTLPAVGGAGMALRWLATRPGLRGAYGVAVVALGLATLGQALSIHEGGGVIDRGHGHSDHAEHNHHQMLGLLTRDAPAERCLPKTNSTAGVVTNAPHVQPATATSQGRSRDANAPIRPDTRPPATTITSDTTVLGNRT